jgi:hypothetical protein
MIPINVPAKIISRIPTAGRATRMKKKISMRGLEATVMVWRIDYSYGLGKSQLHQHTSDRREAQHSQAGVVTFMSRWDDTSIRYVKGEDCGYH